MKKYIVCSLCLIAIISAGYYTSYSYFSKTETQTLPDKIAVEVAGRENTVRSDTKLIIESYDAKENISLKETLTMPALYLGLTREEVIEKLKEYMENLSIKDLEQGLVSYELVHYSKDYMMLKKTYNPDENFQKYFIKLYRGRITVYYSDRKTVYEYTDININDLPEELQGQIINGMDVKDEKSLYDFLENYST